MAVLHNKPIQVYLRPDQLDQLRALALRRRLSMAELVRQGVDKVLGEVPPEEDSLNQIIGMMDSGLGDLAANHDTYLAKWFLEDHSR